MTQLLLELAELPAYRYECLDAVEFCRKIPDKSVKLVMTSPPYNIGKDYETRINIQDYIAGFEPLFCELVRVLKDDGSICWQVGNYVDDGEVFPLDIYFYPLLKSLGLKLRNRIIWHKLTRAARPCSACVVRQYAQIWDIPNVKNNHPEKLDIPVSSR